MIGQSSDHLDEKRQGSLAFYVQIKRLKQPFKQVRFHKMTKLLSNLAVAVSRLVAKGITIGGLVCPEVVAIVGGNLG